MVLNALAEVWNGYPKADTSMTFALYIPEPLPLKMLYTTRHVLVCAASPRACCAGVAAWIRLAYRTAWAGCWIWTCWTCQRPGPRHSSTSAAVSGVSRCR